MQSSSLPAAFIATLLALTWMELGCSGAPVPIVARAGTTVTLPITDEVTGGSSIGYGTFPLYTDPQRGALGFELHDPSLAPADTFVTFLPVRVISRVAPDPASQAGRDGGIFSVLTGDYLVHQIAALLDIPGDVEAGIYDIRIDRYAHGLDALFGIPPIDGGPAESILWGIEILDSPGDQEDFSPFLATLGAGGPATVPNADILKVIPSPKLIVRLPDGPQTPAAATIDIGFDPSRVAILDAIVNRMVTQAALVTHTAVDADTVRIHHVYPAADRRDLALVFNLVNPVGNFDPVAVADFVVESTTFYDGDGVEYAGSGFSLVEIR